MARSRSHRRGARDVAHGRAAQPLTMSPRYGAANDAWSARSIRRLALLMKHRPLRGPRT